MEKDPNEWENLVSKTEMQSTIEKMREWLPKRNEKPAPGSRSRILTRDSAGKVVWEGKEIDPDAPIPELAPSIKAAVAR